MEPAGRVQNTYSWWESPAGGPTSIKRVLTLVEGKSGSLLQRFREGRGAGKSTTSGGREKHAYFSFAAILNFPPGGLLRQRL